MERLLSRIFVLVGMSFFLMGCGKPNPSQKRNWPAYVQSLEGFTEAESEGVKLAVSDLNELAKKTLVSPEENSGYPIRFVRIAKQAQNPQYGGLATARADYCLIELTDTLFIENSRQNNSTYTQSVVWHEVGHCAGLEHAKDEHEVMSAVTSPFSDYTPEVLERFLARLAPLMKF